VYSVDLSEVSAIANPTVASIAEITEVTLIR